MIPTPPPRKPEVNSGAHKILKVKLICISTNANAKLDQLTKAKREEEDFKGKLASTKEDMTLRLGDIFVNIAKAESEMSSIKTESEGYTNRINDLENQNIFAYLPMQM
jgi:vacuolar-type H+-ATPase subunit D/Vma8